MANLYKNINSGTSSYSSSPLKKLELQNAHEQVQLKEQHEHEERMADMQYRHEANLNNQALGCFGRIFGSQENSSRNITGIICLSFVAGATLTSLIVYFCKEDTAFVKKRLNPVYISDNQNLTISMVMI
ncbi:hypothetical protein [Alistipes putredinis]|uniref:hypothetical protein n=1 Tax=Alistipes putredinis TaxID=28117 RepID=UPI002672E539|nr:hypothetical protein [Alistipes putredinis]